MVRDTDTSHSGAVNEGRDSGGWSPQATEFDDIMLLCEKLLSEVDSGRRRLTIARAITLAVSLAAVLSVILLAVASRNGIPALIVAVAEICVIASCALGFTQTLTRSLKSQVRRDELIMADLIGMQREVLPLLAREEKWSSTRLFVAQKRLERFPVEAEPVPVRRPGRLR